MKILRSTIPLLIALSLSAQAQTYDRPRGQGYIFLAPGMAVDSSRIPGGSTIHLGGGAEAFIYQGLGVGAEIGALGPWSGFSDQVFGVGSANLSYHFLPATKDRKLEPFVTTGYTLFFRAGVAHGMNVGAGFNRWLNNNLALRFEVRDNFAGGNGFGYGHFIGFRLGVTMK